MLKKIAVLGAAAGLAVSGAGYAVASGVHHDAQSGPRTLARTSVSPIVCDGGKQLQVKNRIVNTPFTFSEGATPDVPGASAVISGPKYGKDTLVVTFSAESRLSGSTGTQDWIGLEVLVDGTPIQPYTAAGDVMALSGSPTWNMHAATFCTRIGSGKHVVKVRTNLADFDADDTLGGWLDDYTLSVERSQ